MLVESTELRTGASRVLTTETQRDHSRVGLLDKDSAVLSVTLMVLTLAELLALSMAVWKEHLTAVLSASSKVATMA
jgi:hypothetical protein